MAGRRAHARGHRPGKRKGKPSRSGPLTKKEKRDMKEFGETFPSALKPLGKNERFQKVSDHTSVAKKVVESSEEESEVEDAYEELVRSIQSSSATSWDRHGLPSSGSESDQQPSEASESDDGLQLPVDEESGEGSDVEEREQTERTRDMSAADVPDDALSSNNDSYDDDDCENDEDDGDHEEDDDDQSEDDSDKDDDGDTGDQDEDDQQQAAHCDSDVLTADDPFCMHFETVISDKEASSLREQHLWKHVELKVPSLGSATYSHILDSAQAGLARASTGAAVDACLKHVPRRVRDLVEATLRRHVVAAAAADCSAKDDGKPIAAVRQQRAELSELQRQLLAISSNYTDVFYPCTTHLTGEEVRFVYCLHAVTHILKTRGRVIENSAAIKSGSASLDDDRIRDQGLTRPKVLLLLPTRNSALKCVQMMMSLLMPKGQSFVSNKKRFFTEYRNEEDDEGSVAKQLSKPDDYRALFSGNTDDCFRIGVGVAKKGLKLYTEFYSSDIIIASPLGLRTVIGAEGDESRDFDFLSSIEVLVMDQADVFLMQNWDHVLHIFSHLHLQPKESHDVDFSRVRMWNINGWSKYYRQTIMLSSINSPELSALFNKQCYNYAGKLRIARPPTSGSICRIVAQLPQVFQKISAQNFGELADARFNYFVKKVLPDYRSAVRAQTLIFIPSYFDYVRIRNYFKKEGIEAALLCEYTKERAISRGRSDFYHGRVPFMLYTERLHFYRRFIIRGVRHLIFYGLPHYAHFYSDMCNAVKDSKRPERTSGVEDASCVVLYAKYEAMFLSEIVGNDRAGRMVTSARDVHMLVTGDL